MDSREYEIMFQMEERHWWYLGMASITRALLNRWVNQDQRLKILDAGSGTGAAMTTYLADYGDVTGVDMFAEAVNLSCKRNIPRLARASVLDLPLASTSFDLVTSFDVLCARTVVDEIHALHEFFRVLIPGGQVLIRLPAYDWLRRRHDERVHTRRRFTIRSLRSLLEESGFYVQHMSYANTFLFPFALVKRLGEHLLPPDYDKSDFDVGGMNTLFTQILSWEAPLVSRCQLSFGLSVFALARKPYE